MDSREFGNAEAMLSCRSGSIRRRSPFLFPITLNSSLGHWRVSFGSPGCPEPCSRPSALTDDSSLSGLDENDPASVARYMKKMGEAMGEDVGDDVEAAMEEAGGGDGSEHGGSDAD